MTPRSTLLLGSALGALTPAAAEADDQPAPGRHAQDTSEPSAHVSAWTSLRAGVVEARYPSATLGEVRSEAGQARLFRLGAAARVARNAWVGAHVAYVWAGVEQPAGSYRAANVWGNPILFATLSQRDVAPAIGATIDGDLSLSLGVPVAAERGAPYEQLDRRALAIADALEGMTNPEIFTPNVFPMAWGGTLVLPTRYLQLSLGLELPLLLRLSDATIPDGASSSAVGFIPNGHVHAAAWPWTWFGLSLGATLAWPVAEPVYLSSRTGDPQVMLTPRLLFPLGALVLLTLDAAVAAGGPATGTASAELSARVAF